MRPSNYPDLGWSRERSRFARTLRVAVIAGSVGAVGGGVGAFAAFGTAGDSPSEHFRFPISKPRASVQVGIATALHPQSTGPAQRGNVAPAAAPTSTLAFAASAPTAPRIPPAPAGRQAHSRQARPSAVQDFYDRVEPSPSGGAATRVTLDPSIPLPLPAPNRAVRRGKRAERARLADAAPASSVSPLPRGPMSILPRRRGRPGSFAHDQWRDSRRDNWGAGLYDSFGSFGGGWRD